AVQGYRGLMAMLPERDLGAVVLWNSNSSLPPGLLPTILDRAIGLPAQQWLDVDIDMETLYASDRAETPASGSPQSDKAEAGPRGGGAAAVPRHIPDATWLVAAGGRRPRRVQATLPSSDEPDTPGRGAAGPGSGHPFLRGRVADPRGRRVFRFPA